MWSENGAACSGRKATLSCFGADVILGWVGGGE